MQTKTNKTNKKEVDKIRKEPTERTTTTAGNEPTKQTVNIPPETKSTNNRLDCKYITRVHHPLIIFTIPGPHSYSDMNRLCIESGNIVRGDNYLGYSHFCIEYQDRTSLL